LKLTRKSASLRVGIETNVPRSRAEDLQPRYAILATERGKSIAFFLDVSLHSFLPTSGNVCSTMLHRRDGLGKVASEEELETTFAAFGATESRIIATLRNIAACHSPQRACCKRYATLIISIRDHR